MKFDIPEQKKLVHETLIPMRWGDMDAMGHINNAVYFRYMETARIDWLTSLGFNGAAQGGQGPVIVNAFCNFMRELAYPGQVLLRTYVSNPGRSSFDTWVSMAHDSRPDEVCAMGGATMVWLDTRAKKSTALPDWLRSQLVD